MRYNSTVISYCLPALIVVPLAVIGFSNASAHQKQQECLAKNIYYESRGEPTHAQKVVAYITMARAADRTEWGKTPCETVYQKIKGVPQFSWTPYVEGPKGPQWEAAQTVAKAVYADPVAAVPAHLRCARYYKRSDDKGVSDRSKRYFGTLQPLGQFGSHTAYYDIPKKRAARACVG